MKIPLQTGRLRDQQKPLDTEETTATAAAQGTTSSVAVPVGRTGGSTRDAFGRQPTADVAPSATKPPASIFAAIEAGALKGAGGNALTSADLAGIMARLSKSAAGQPTRPESFAPAYDVLGRLKRLMELVEQRRAAAAQQGGVVPVQARGQPRRRPERGSLRDDDLDTDDVPSVPRRMPPPPRRPS